jgi:DNA-binding NarL/FixJ family response regulator
MKTLNYKVVTRKPVKNPKSRRLTTDEIREMGELSKSGWDYGSIARKFRVQRATVKRACNQIQTKVTVPADIAKIQKELYSLKREGWSYAQIAAKYGRSRGVIYNYIKDYTEKMNFAS